MNKGRYALIILLFVSTLIFLGCKRNQEQDFDERNLIFIREMYSQSPSAVSIKPKIIILRQSGSHFEPNEITISKGESSIIELLSDQSFVLSEERLGVDVKIAKGEANSFSFVPKMAGDYEFNCVYSCKGLSNPLFVIEVMSKEVEK